MERIKNEINNVVMKVKTKLIPLTVILFSLNTVTAKAAPNPGESASNWGRAQIAPIAVLVTLFLLVREIKSKNIVKAGVFLILGGVVSALIAGPELITQVGNWVLEITGFKGGA